MSEAIQTKRCSHCKQIKQLIRFNKCKSTTDGFHNQCKSCHNEVNKKYGKSKRGKDAYKRYRQSIKGKNNQKRYKHSEKGRDYLKKVRKSIKFKAKMAVNNAIANGKMPRANTLQCHYYLQNPDCKKQAEQYHHWHGYEKEHWLDVVPACIKCHTKTRQSFNRCQLVCLEFQMKSNE